MFKKLKNYREYKRNQKIMKRELAGICAVIFPAIRTFSEKKAELLQFVIHLADSTKNASDNDLFDRIISEITDKLTTEENT